MRKLFYIAVVLLIIAVIIFVGSSNSWFEGASDLPSAEPPVDSVTEATLKRYLEMEIRDYEGVRLDPSIGPRDNSIAGIQQVGIDDYKLMIIGLVDRELSYSYNQVLEKESFEKLITLYCVEGWDATVLWKGVRIMDLLEEAGIRDQNCNVIFHCVDGYTTSMPLETVESRDMLLAYSSNGITLPESLGFPFIVVAEDKAGYKWARWVNKIELSDDLTYEGYWESRGYSNEADIRR